MQRTIFTCDICGGEQGQSNHWFRIVIVEKEFHCFPLGPDDTDGIHACGEACASKRFSEFLGAVNRGL